MNTNRVVLSELSKAEYLALRPRNYSTPMNEFDPFRPIPTVEDEGRWWEEEVVSGRHLLRAILVEGSVVGLVHGFSFDHETACCEIGLGIFEKENQGQGFASQAIEAWTAELQRVRGVRVFRAETNRLNRPAVRLLEKMGFRRTDAYEDDGVEWVVMENEPGRDQG